MSQVQQLYCTHCTHGTSALDRSREDLANKVLGYSARAGSLQDIDELHRYYRQVERYLYYALPEGTPGEQKLKLTAESAGAPQRLVYCPSISGLQMLGQVCYRQKDVEGRPGSYFAHVLAAPMDANGQNWTTLAL